MWNGTLGETAAGLSGTDGPAAPVFDTIGGLTTPLVCLVIGTSLAGIPRDPAIVAVVALRTVAGLGLGLFFGLVVVPAHRQRADPEHRRVDRAHRGARGARRGLRHHPIG